MERDAYWNTVICWVLVVVCIIAMVAGKFAESWSQNHAQDYDFLLYGAVGLISVIFFIRSFSHPTRTRRAAAGLREEHWSRIAAYSFMGIAIFGVNSDLWIVETLHLVFTFVGIASATACMIFYHDKRSMARYASYVTAFLGVTGFLIGFLTKWWTIADGEAMVAAPIAVWLILTTKKA